MEDLATTDFENLEVLVSALYGEARLMKRAMISVEEELGPSSLANIASNEVKSN